MPNDKQTTNAIDEIFSGLADISNEQRRLLNRLDTIDDLKHEAGKRLIPMIDEIHNPVQQKGVAVVDGDYYFYALDLDLGTVHKFVRVNPIIVTSDLND